MRRTCAIDAAAIGVDEGPVAVPDPAGAESLYLFRIDERRTQSFDDAREDLATIASSLAQQDARPWIALIVDSAEIDPRYGSGVSVANTGDAPLTNVTVRDATLGLSEQIGSLAPKGVCIRPSGSPAPSPRSASANNGAPARHAREDVIDMFL